MYTKLSCGIGRDRKCSVGVGLHILEPVSQPPPKDDLYTCLRPFLIFGRVIGIIPIESVFQRHVQLLKYKRVSFTTLTSSAVTLLMIINAAVAAVRIIKPGSGKSNVLEIAWSTSSFFFFLCPCFLYIYFLRHGNQLIQLFIKWTQLNLYYTQEDTKLFRDVNLTAGLLILSAISENAVLHLRLFPVFDEDGVEPEETPVLEVFYQRSYPYWAQIFPYHWTLSIMLMLANKFAWYAWNFSDILITVFARAFYFKYRALVITAETQLFSPKPLADSDLWKTLTVDHQKICDLLNEFSSFLSPLIFVSYAINIFNVCLHIQTGLIPSVNVSIASNLYAIWSLVELIVKVFVLSLSAARVNESAKSVLKLYHKCPEEYYSQEVQRAEKKIQCGREIGFTGFNCFIITKPFILTLISVIFTFEIVLLQANGSTMCH